MRPRNYKVLRDFGGEVAGRRKWAASWFRVGRILLNECRLRFPRVSFFLVWIAAVLAAYRVLEVSGFCNRMSGDVFVSWPRQADEQFRLCLAKCFWPRWVGIIRTRVCTRQTLLSRKLLTHPARQTGEAPAAFAGETNVR